MSQGHIVPNDVNERWSWDAEDLDPEADSSAATLRMPAGSVAALVLLFVALAAVAWHRVGPMPLDAAIDRGLRQTQDGVGWKLAQAVSFVASGPVVGLLGLLAGAVLFLRRRSMALAFAVVAAPALAGVVEVLLKDLVARARPGTAVLTGESGNGFPSGHVSGFTALAVVLLVVWGWYGVRRTDTARAVAGALVGVAVLIVAISRVAVGAHYASDTVGGALLGGAIGLVTVPFVLLVAGRVRSRHLR
ncbi:MAG: putative rane protein [Ilumatobacteraceae bacterium]|nr:putative rane protein [Ilumatobacteraceae bacterium]